VGGVLGWVAASVAVATAAETRPTIACSEQKTTDRVVVEVPVDVRAVKKIQKSVEDGHQPWRADPVLVTYFLVDNPLSDAVKQENFSVERETGTEAVVFGRGARCWYRVHLKAFMGTSRGQPGFWTPTRVEYGVGRD
jgi:Flp pilus assembly protein CpaB